MGEIVMMEQFDTEKMATVTLRHQQHGAETFSAILERDPKFLNWNRFHLIGNRDDYARSLIFMGTGQFQWQLFENPEWPSSGEYETSGICIFNNFNMTHGASINNESIQKFADISILEYSDKRIGTENKQSSLIYSFLPRPAAWYVYPRRPLVDRLNTRGSWHNISRTNLKIRFLSYGQPSNDARVSQETQLIQIPGVEIQSTSNTTIDDFTKRSCELWFKLKILISFRFQIKASLLTETISTPEQFVKTWHTKAIEPKTTLDINNAAEFHGRIDGFLVKGAASLARLVDHKELLHAAVWVYVSSFKSQDWEGALTDRVEAIERLVTVYEKTTDLNRSLMPNKDWKPIKSALKKTIDTLQLEEVIEKTIKSNLSRPPNLRLTERIERMAQAYPMQCQNELGHLLDGLDLMISTRNTIVHGRMVEDMNRLYVETLRAKAIFEELFLGLLDCKSFHSTHVTYSNIELLEREITT